jgi:hypothetical protein
MSKVNYSQAATLNQQLSKSATSEEVRNYFLTVFALKQNTSADFPINLDDVWPLAYSQKKDAMRILQREFMEGEEYQAFQNGKVLKIKDLKNGVRSNVFISLNVMEYLIARKVKEVFNVYREVFHQRIDKALQSKNNVRLLKSQLNDSEVLDARDVPYSFVMENGVKVSRVFIKGCTLYALTDLRAAYKIASNNSKIAKQINAVSENAVKLCLFGKPTTWFVNDLGLDLIKSRQGVHNQTTLAL